ncbi:hypothetical protein HKD37_14G040189 [Glycine soja]
MNIGRCNGTIDPDENLDAFTTQVNLYSNDNSVLCKVFPTSLKAPSLMWYKCLQVRSVDSLTTLSQHFRV